jgi:ketosteroid isomerase-like protein
MTSANVEVVRRQVDAFNRRDPDAIAADWHPEGIFEPASVAPIEGRPYRGPDGIRKFLEDYADTWDDSHLEYASFVDLGERVLALGRIEVRHRDSDVPIAQPHAMVYEFRNGQIVRLRSYLDHAEARAAADAMQA